MTHLNPVRSPDSIATSMMPSPEKAIITGTRINAFVPYFSFSPILSIILTHSRTRTQRDPRRGSLCLAEPNRLFAFASPIPINAYTIPSNRNASISLPPSKLTSCDFSGMVSTPNSSAFRKGDRIAGAIYGCKDSHTGGFADFLVADPDT